VQQSLKNSTSQNIEVVNRKTINNPYRILFIKKIKMKLLIKKNGFKVSAVLMLLALSQSVFAAGVEQTTDSSTFSEVRAVGFFTILVFSLLAPALKSSRRTIK
jgi:hypothetical protein